MNIQTIESELELGQVAPHRLAEMKDWIAAKSSQYMDRELELKMLYAQFFLSNRDSVKSDKALLMSWNTTPEGLDQMRIETLQRKMKVLREAISSHLRVADNQARNLY